MKVVLYFHEDEWRRTLHRHAKSERLANGKKYLVTPLARRVGVESLHIANIFVLFCSIEQLGAKTEKGPILVNLLSRCRMVPVTVSFLNHGPHGRSDSCRFRMHRPSIYILELLQWNVTL